MPPSDSLRSKVAANAAVSGNRFPLSRLPALVRTTATRRVCCSGARSQVQPPASRQRFRVNPEGKLHSRLVSQNPTVFQSKTFAVGICTGRTPRVAAVLERADAALYQAKHEGRNRVTPWTAGATRRHRPSGNNGHASARQELGTEVETGVLGPR